MMKIAIIGGGNMGGAIAKGMASGSFVKANDIMVADKNAESLARVKEFNRAINVVTDNKEAVKDADLIIVAVKPWLLEEVIAELKDSLDYSKQSFVSIVAGVTFESLKKMLDKGDGAMPVMFRIIPNTAISVGESVNFIAVDGAAQTQVDELTAIFRELGQTIVVDESMIVAGTSLASCGIAFALKYMDASIKGGVELGFSEEDARSMVMQTVKGALEMMRINGTMPQVEIDKVTTPGGITLKGLKAMAESGFDEAVFAGLRDCK